MIRIGNQGEPITEKIYLGWTITSPDNDLDITKMMLKRSTTSDNDQLECKVSGY